MFSNSLAFWRLIDMVHEQGHEVGCVLADAAYDCKDYWNGMEERGIEAAVWTRGNAVSAGTRREDAGHVRST